jgi:cobalt-zinc-cadmium efflux system outer membrane protein
MRRLAWLPAIGLVAVTGLPGGARAQEGLTLDAAISRARTRAPGVVGAMRRLDEARARQRNQPFLRDNPEVEAALGRRTGEGPDNVQVGVSQTLELGGARGARRAQAVALVSRESAALADAQRGTLRDVASAFLRGLHAEERVRVAQVSETFAADLRRIAERRHEAGDVAALDVNTAVSALGRARAELKAAQAARVGALGDLRVLLDIRSDEPLSLAGRLYEPGEADLAALVAVAVDRPDLQVLKAELAEAETEVRAGRAAAWPEVTPGVRYERDDGENVLWGGLTVRLPLFDRGQLQRAAGEARAAHLREELAAFTRAVETRVRAAHESYLLRAAAADEMQQTVAAMDDNEQLARRSYEVGQIGLAELLLVRRETTETRRAWLEALLEAAQARYDLAGEAGVTQ